MKIWQGFDMTGNPLLMATAFLWTTSLQFFTMGLLGEVSRHLLREPQRSELRHPLDAEPRRRAPRLHDEAAAPHGLNAIGKSTAASTLLRVRRASGG